MASARSDIHDPIFCNCANCKVLMSKRYFKCLICENVTLCDKCNELCIKQDVQVTGHSFEHAVQLVFSPQEFKLYFAGDKTVRFPARVRGLTCPYCYQIGLSDLTLLEHVTELHEEGFPGVYCPICYINANGNPDIWERAPLNCTFKVHLGRTHLVFHAGKIPENINVPRLYELIRETRVMSNTRFPTIPNRVLEKIKNRYCVTEGLQCSASSSNNGNSAPVKPLEQDEDLKPYKGTYLLDDVFKQCYAKPVKIQRLWLQKRGKFCLELMNCTGAIDYDLD